VQLIVTYESVLALMGERVHHEPMPIPTHIAVTLTRKYVEQGGPKPRFVRRPHR
jgi:hypothetical protein